MPKSMTLDDCFAKYGEPLYVGYKHLIWKDTEQNRAIKATRPGYFADGTVIITSQSWHEPVDPLSPHPSTEEMAECMRKFGFRQATLSDWQRIDGTIARNVKPRDFIKTKDGVVPVDVDLSSPKKNNA